MMLGHSLFVQLLIGLILSWLISPFVPLKNKFPMKFRSPKLSNRDDEVRHIPIINLNNNNSAVLDFGREDMKLTEEEMIKTSNPDPQVVLESNLKKSTNKAKEAIKTVYNEYDDYFDELDLSGNTSFYRSPNLNNLQYFVNATYNRSIPEIIEHVYLTNVTESDPKSQTARAVIRSLTGIAIISAIIFTLTYYLSGGQFITRHSDLTPAEKAQYYQRYYDPDEILRNELREQTKQLYQDNSQEQKQEK